MSLKTHGECLWSLEEFLDGGTLTQRMRARPIVAEELKPIARSLISALDHIAGKNLVHRDIKPDNIMFRADGEPVIVDFGIVRDLSKASVTATWALHGPGTMFYAPPEQINNEKHLIDWRADQFALGVTFSLILLNMHPYDHGQDTPGVIVGRVSQKHTQSPKFIEAVRSIGLNQIIRMTAPWPIQRFRNPSELLAVWT